MYGHAGVVRVTGRELSTYLETNLHLSNPMIAWSLFGVVEAFAAIAAGEITASALAAGVVTAAAEAAAADAAAGALAASIAAAEAAAAAAAEAAAVTAAEAAAVAAAEAAAVAATEAAAVAATEAAATAAAEAAAVAATEAAAVATSSAALNAAIADATALVEFWGQADAIAVASAEAAAADAAATAAAEIAAANATAIAAAASTAADVTAADSAAIAAAQAAAAAAATDTMAAPTVIAAAVDAAADSAAIAAADGVAADAAAIATADTVAVQAAATVAAEAAAAQALVTEAAAASTTLSIRIAIAGVVITALTATINLTFGILKNKKDGSDPNLGQLRVRYVCQSVFPHLDSWKDGTFGSNVNIGVNSSAPASVLLHAFVGGSAIVNPVVKMTSGARFWTAVSHFIFAGDSTSALNGQNVDYTRSTFNASAFEQKPASRSVELSLQTTHLATSTISSQKHYAKFIEAPAPGYTKQLEFQIDKEYIFGGDMPTSLTDQLPPNSEVLGDDFVYAGNMILTLANMTTMNDAVNPVGSVPSSMIWTAGGTAVVNEPTSVTVNASPGKNSNIGLVNCLRPSSGAYSVVENKFQLTVDITSSAQILLQPNLTVLRLYLRTPVGNFNASPIPDDPPQGFNEYSLASPDSSVIVSYGGSSSDLATVIDATRVHSPQDRPFSSGSTLYEQTLVVDLKITRSLELAALRVLSSSSPMELTYVFPEGKYSYIEAASPAEKGTAEYLNQTFTSAFQVLENGRTYRYFSMF
jgi:hypothetical protein